MLSLIGQPDLQGLALIEASRVLTRLVVFDGDFYVLVGHRMAVAIADHDCDLGRQGWWLGKNGLWCDEQR